MQDYDTGDFTEQELSEAALQPRTAVGVKPGTSADMPAKEGAVLVFEQPEFVTLDKCKRAMRRRPTWDEFPRCAVCFDSSRKGARV